MREAEPMATLSGMERSTSGSTPPRCLLQPVRTRIQAHIENEQGLR